MFALSGLRADGRRPNETRRMRCRMGRLSGASGAGVHGPRVDGSAYVEMGSTKVLALLAGPREARRGGGELPDRATLSCSCSLAPFAGLERKRRRAAEAGANAGGGAGGGSAGDKQLSEVRGAHSERCGTPKEIVARPQRASTATLSSRPPPRTISAGSACMRGSRARCCCIRCPVHPVLALVAHSAAGSAVWHLSSVWLPRGGGARRPGARCRVAPFPFGLFSCRG